MPRRKREDIQVKGEEIIVKSMEEVLHESMIPYSEHVILERALPRVEDGLKPVQRRILYTMHELGNTADKPHRKCARIVGDCLGKYHPHGDSSVYDALARMAQPFVMRAPLVDGHGNFGSIDGDSPAAMRYTEARMATLASEMLRDLDKDTVSFHLNFDDTQKEPDLLPARFPNLLVNGSNGIAVGLATNIPPHNLGETIDAAIAMMDNPKLTTAELMEYVKAPDFPTGGILAKGDELLQAYETGRGRIQVRAKTHIENSTAGRKLIVITEIPYQLNKASMLEKILKVSEEKKGIFTDIYDIRDESDRMGMRAVIEIRRDADPDNILNALYKYTDLQTTFGINMVAIADGKPLQLGLKKLLEYFIRHQKDVVTRRTKYDLDQAQARAHILEGLIIAVDNIDEVIALIRSSKSPKEARIRLCERFSLTEIQSQAILDMRLQRLTNLEIVALKKEYADLEKLIKQLQGILASEKKLIGVIKGELGEIRDKYADSRRTEVVDTFDEIIIKEDEPVPDETVVTYSFTGFIKRLTPANYARLEPTEPSLFAIRCTTADKLVAFTTKGICYLVSVSAIAEARPRERGIAITGLLSGFEKDEQIVYMDRLSQENAPYMLSTRKGTVKRLAYEDVNIRRSRFSVIGLKGDDKLISVITAPDGAFVLIVTSLGMVINFLTDNVSIMGRSAAGVKGVMLTKDDYVVAAFAHNAEGEVLLASDQGYIKRCLLVDFDRQARGGKGQRAFQFGKNTVYGSRVTAALTVRDPYDFVIKQKNGFTLTLSTEDIPISARSDKPQPYAVVVLDDIVTDLVKKQA